MTDIFPLSLFICFFLWFFNKNLKISWFHNLRKSPQTYHKKSTSRFGGIAIIIPLLAVPFFADIEEYNFLFAAVVCTMPAFIMGLLDDLNFKITPLTRILFSLPTPLLLFFYLGVKVEYVLIEPIDNLLLNPYFSAIFFVFAIVGIINAFNIIDGFNGLLLSYCMMIMLSVVLINGFKADLNWVTFMVAIFFATLGVFLFNFPFGKIFLGDGGAYLLGVLIPVGLIKLTYENNLSPWYVLALLIYPVTEVIFSIIRKVVFRKMSAMQPDGLHFHMLIYKKITKKVGFRRIRLRHFLVTFFITLLNFPFMLASNYFSDNTNILIFICIWFIIVYMLIYFFMIPKFLFKRK